MSSPIPLLEPPAQFDAESLVNWIETSMIIERSASWSRSAIRNAFPALDGPDQAELDQALALIDTRSEITPGTYPFRRDSEDVVEWDPVVDARVYEHLVLLSRHDAPYRAAGDQSATATTFDLLVREAAITILGRPDARGVRFGYPVQDGRPTNLREAVEWLSELTGIPIQNLESVPSHGNDGGVDVVAWRPFPDAGTLFPINLWQSTVAKDFKRKPGDIAPNQWASIMLFGCPPSVGLAVPFVVDPDSEEWTQVGWRANLLLERLRICRSLDGVDLASMPEWLAIDQWNAQERSAWHSQLQPSPAAQQRRPKHRRRHGLARYSERDA